MEEIDPTVYLNVGKHLLHRDLPNCTEPSRFNTAVNRAYYSALLTTRSVLERHHRARFSDSSPRSHQDVLDALSRLESWWSEDIWDILKAMKVKRESADYRLTNPFDFAGAENVIFEAESILKLLRDTHAD